MKNELFTNANYFDTKKLNIIYVLSRIKKFTKKHLSFRTCKNYFLFIFFRTKTCFRLHKND